MVMVSMQESSRSAQSTARPALPGAKLKISAPLVRSPGRADAGCHVSSRWAGFAALSVAAVPRRQHRPRPLQGHPKTHADPWRWHVRQSHPLDEGTRTFDAGQLAVACLFLVWASR